MRIRLYLAAAAVALLAAPQLSAQQQPAAQRLAARTTREHKRFQHAVPVRTRPGGAAGACHGGAPRDGQKCRPAKHFLACVRLSC